MLELQTSGSFERRWKNLPNEARLFKRGLDVVHCKLSIATSRAFATEFGNIPRMYLHGISKKMAEPMVKTHLKATNRKCILCFIVKKGVLLKLENNAQHFIVKATHQPAAILFNKCEYIRGIFPGSTGRVRKVAML